MSDRRSLLDNTRRSNFLRESFGGYGLSREHYISLLLREYDQWLTLYKKTQKSLANSSFKITLSREDLKNLSNDDEIFLQNRPDYKAIAENARSYAELVMYWLKLSSSYENLHKKLIDDIQDKKQIIINDLLREESEICTECNNGFCMKDIHYLVGQNEFPDIHSLDLSDSEEN